MTAITTQGYVGIAGRNETFDLLNTAFPNYIDGLNGQDNILSSNEADFLVGGLGRDLIRGMNGNDLIYGDQFWNDETTNANVSLAAAADAISGGNGDDTIFAGGGNNFVTGGDGNDLIMGGSGNEWLQGGADDDTVYGGSGDDLLVGGGLRFSDVEAFLNSNIGNITTNFNGLNDAAGDTFIDVGDNFGIQDPFANPTGNDYLNGGAGNDTLYGGDGIDTMVGDVGDDLYYVDNASDVVFEVAGQGYDVVVSSALSFTLGNEFEAVRLEEGTSAVYAIGNAQTNTVLGNSGDNLLEGGAGADDISGLGGSDIFALRIGQAHGDVIYEFEGNGAGNGDVLLFVGYGTQAQGATLTQIDSIRWQVTSWDHSVTETIVMLPGSGFNAAFDVQFV